MRIRALRVAGVGLFREPVAIEGMSGELDVLAGPNELGKSTLFRAIEAVFLKRHTITGQAVAALASRGGSGPSTIEADFEAQGKRWRVRKSFGKGRLADAVLCDLTTGRQVARGPDADERLADLIGLNGSAGGRFGLLWVGQQQAIIMPTPDYDADKRRSVERGQRDLLREAIGREIDEIGSTDLSRAVARKIEAALLTQLQAKKRLPRKGSPYEQALQRRADTMAALDVARKKMRDAEARLQRLAELVERRGRDHGAETMQALRERAATAAATLAEAGELARVVRQLQSEETAARLEAEQAADRLARHLAAVDEVRRLQDHLRALDEAMPETSAAADEAETALVRTAGEQEAVASELRALQAAEALARDLARLRELQHVLARAEDAAQRVQHLADGVIANPATPERMRALDAATRALAEAEALHDVPAAARLNVALTPAAVGRVRIGGETVGATDTRDVTASLGIEVDGVGRFDIELPDEAERARRSRDLEHARRQLAVAFESLGVADRRAAEELASRRAVEAGQLAGARAELAALAPEGLDSLRVVATELDQKQAAAVAAAEALPDDVTARLATLQERAQALTSARDRLVTARAEALSALTQLRREREAAAVRLQQLASGLGRDAERQAEGERLELASRRASEALRDKCEQRSSAAQRAPAGGEIAQFEAAARAAHADLERAEQALHRLSIEIAELDGEVRVAGEAQVSREVARLEGELTRLDRDIGQHELEIAALELLARRIAAAEEARRDRFLVPVTRCLEPYLQQVFGDARPHLGDDFAMHALERGDVREDIGELSDGTREQIAVLVRLGFAGLLTEAGLSVPLILDDALVFSDDERIARMFDALRVASGLHQVVVFTCHAKAFADLGGTRLQLSPWVREATAI